MARPSSTSFADYGQSNQFYSNDGGTFRNTVSFMSDFNNNPIPNFSKTFQPNVLNAPTPNSFSTDYQPRGLRSNSVPFFENHDQLYGNNNNNSTFISNTDSISNVDLGYMATRDQSKLSINEPTLFKVQGSSYFYIDGDMIDNVQSDLIANKSKWNVSMDDLERYFVLRIIK